MKYLIWDFDGTLGFRQNGMWSAALLEILLREKPELHVTLEQIRPFLQSGFPWHHPDQPHTEIKTAEQWWNALDKVFEQAFLGVGVSPREVEYLSKQVRSVYVLPGSWRLFDDVLPTLERLSVAGWTHLVLSNHTPELPQIMRFLQLDEHISSLFNSAETGYEKPHPQAYLTLLASLDRSATTWMIGDNMSTDVSGAEAAGIPAILVRKYHANAEYYCDRLDQIAQIIAP